MDGLWDCTVEEYRADPRDSYSSLKLFDSNIRQYAAKHIHRTVVEDKDTPALRLGGALHCMLLEGPLVFEERYHVWAKESRATTAGKKSFSQAVSECYGRTLLNSEEYAEVIDMTQGALRNPAVRKLVDQTHGVGEASIRWTDPSTGLEMKARIDKLFPDGRFLEVKTTLSANPKDFRWDAVKYKYHWQGALYVDGLWQALRLPGTHIIIAIDKGEEHETNVFTLKEQDLATAWLQVQRRMEELAERRRDNNWAGRNENDVVELDLPIRREERE